MNEVQDAVVISEPTGDSQLVVIESLRSSIELEHRFKTSLSGYRKKDVQAYLDGLSKQFMQTVGDQKQELERLKAENIQLYSLVDGQRERIENVRAEERRKVQLEYDMQEGLVETLRDKNSKLMAENQEKQVEIASLNEQLSTFRSIAEERTKQLCTLTDKLEKLLTGNFEQCNAVVSAWKTEFLGVIETETKQVAEQ